MSEALFASSDMHNITCLCKKAFAAGAIPGGR